ncbi:molybdopterin cofactor-binding domain-containing protein [Jannaschia formosa]|uniref:molybdopterin cofactor-binding domain-containing protein n=1 Tax=Jannaschia formosa TaxID=2259592 RepID=UPI000E1BE466|nr:molybdopterin cofactor-binding domain-containing protein [Jannaschia formosa]TFL17518.1 xanthine dehydrogenase family protein molybdopterin-binding subunit [Jannaschia formosa]
MATPDVVRAQMEGGIGFGLGSVLMDEIALGPGGRVQQTSFASYPLLRLPQIPRTEVAILPSDQPPSGVGEPPTPPIAAAVGNAWRSLIGRAVHHLPFRPAA